MSFITNVESEFKKIENVFVKLFKNEPSWAQVAETDIAFVAPILENIVLVAGGPAADTEVVAVVAAIQSSLVLATKFIQALDSSQNLADALTAVDTNLQDLLTLGAIKNNTKVTEITAFVNVIVGEIKAILTVLPSLKA